MTRGLGFLLAGGLVLVSGGAAALLLPACGIGLPGADFCVSDGDAAAERALAETRADIAALTREIAALEGEVSRVQCAAVHPEPEPLPPVVAAPQPPEGIDSDAWLRRELAAMEGCWELDSVYRAQDIRTGVVTTYDVWRICFDADGAGAAEMRATTGATCGGAITGAFDSAGALSIVEAAGLECSDGSFIYRRDLTCGLDGTGGAACTVEQPEVGRSSTVALRRATENR